MGNINLAGGLLQGLNQGMQVGQQSAIQMALKEYQKQNLDLQGQKLKAEIDVQKARQKHQEWLRKYLGDNGEALGQEIGALASQEAQQAAAQPPIPQPALAPRYPTITEEDIQPGEPPAVIPPRPQPPVPQSPALTGQPPVVPPSLPMGARPARPILGLEGVTLDKNGDAEIKLGTKKATLQHEIEQTPEGPVQYRLIVDQGGNILSREKIGIPGTPSDAVALYQDAAAGFGAPKGTALNREVASRLNYIKNFLQTPEQQAAAIDQLRSEVYQITGKLPNAKQETSAQSALQSAREIENQNAAARAQLETYGRKTGEFQAPLSPQEVGALGVPLGTTGAQAAGRLSLTPQQRETISALAPAQKAVNDIAELSAKVNVFQPGVLNRVKQYATTEWGTLAQTDQNAALLQTKIGTLGNLLRTMGERGVLTEQDVQRANALLPQSSDTVPIAVGKVNALQDFLNEMQQAKLGALTYNPAGGAVVPGPGQTRLKINPKSGKAEPVKSGMGKAPAISEQSVAVSPEDNARISIAEAGFNAGGSEADFLKAIEPILGPSMAKQYVEQAKQARAALKASPSGSREAPATHRYNPQTGKVEAIR